MQKVLGRAGKSISGKRVIVTMTYSQNDDTALIIIIVIKRIVILSLLTVLKKTGERTFQSVLLVFFARFP